MNDLIYEIQSKIRSKILLDHDMGQSTWFRAGGKARGYVTVNNIKDLKIILSFGKHIKYYIIGVGSNLLVRDRGFEGLIIKLGRNFSNTSLLPNGVIVAGSACSDKKLSEFALCYHNDLGYHL